MKSKPFIMLIMLMGLGACNSVSIKPHTLEPGSTIFAKNGGYSMRRSVKDGLEKRGFTVLVGKEITNEDWSDDDSGMELTRVTVPNSAKYVVNVRERREKFNPFWCPFNGFWWWNFNMSISEQKTGIELMTWRGRGCAHSSLRKLNRILDQLEQR